MNLPDLININGKKITMFEFMLTPCATKADLHTWIELFLGLDMPDCVVCDESSASPMDMIWNVYKAVMDGDPIESSQLYFASRDSFKTLSAAILEVLMMVHFRRTCSHMGAISQQADKCYDYFKRFLRKPYLNSIEKLKDTMKRTELDLVSEYDINPYLQIVICTLQGANSEHTNFMCVDKDTKVMLGKSKYKKIKNIQVGDEVITWNCSTGQQELKPVIDVWSSGVKPAYEVIFKNGNSVVSSGDHEFHVVGKGFITLSEIEIGDKVYIKGKASNIKPKTIENFNTVNIKSNLNTSNFEQVVLGSMLGDGGVYKKTTNNAYYKEQHCIEQKEYLDWKRFIIGAHCNTHPISVRSGYTGKKQVGFASGCNPIFNKYANFKQKLQDIERLSPLGLAIWYMDDGCAGRGVKISSESFTKKQNEKLARMLNTNFNIKAKVHKYTKKNTGKTYYYLRGTDRLDKWRLYEICKAHIHPSMMYKFKDHSPYVKKCKNCNLNFIPKHGNAKYCNNAACRAIKESILKTNKVTSIKNIGLRLMYDMTVKDNHNFFVYDGGFNLAQCVDEVDVVQNVQAYQEAKKIPTETPDKKPSITLYISTRKSTFGLVQREVDNAKKSGLQVRSWNIIDVAQACPPEKSQMDKDKIKLYYKESELELIHLKELKELTASKQVEYVEKTLYKGCETCTIAPLCLGRLATKQTSTSMLLKSHVDVEKKFRESTIEDALAQLMCLKPSTHGLVFTSFNEDKSIHSPTKMWEHFMGRPADHEITKNELIETFHKHNATAFAGIDWGWSEGAPSVCVVMFIDKKQNIYVVHEIGLTFTDDPEFVNIIKKTIHSKFGVQMYFPDTAQPASISLLKKANLPVATKVDKDIHLGVQTIKRYMKVPGLGITKIFVLDTCRGFLDEIRKYHLKLDTSNQIISHDQYADEFNHYIDAFRYVIRNRLGRISPIIGSLTINDNSDPVRDNEGQYLRVPSAKELAEELGVSQFKDNRDEISKKDDDDGGGKTGGDAGFTWSF